MKIHSFLQRRCWF